ncbi:MAG: ankyrin repeat domain-containing protein [Candidatus Micrarchaeota archaeon]|nr:ankyrin repeat domain-containing protein [Candidatus Micrarchaeota archaeon]
MAERRRFRERAAQMAKRSSSLLKKLNPEPAVSRLLLNRRLAKVITKPNKKFMFQVDWNVVKALVEAGANPNMREKSQSQYPLLAYAAWAKEKGMCELLLEKGASIDSTSSDGFTALAIAASEGRENHIDICRLLIRKGADIEGKNEDGITPLMLAAQHGHADICALLIESGADIGIKNRKYGANALDLAKSGTGSGETVIVIRLGILLGKDGLKPFLANFRECTGQSFGRKLSLSF